MGGSLAKEPEKVNYLIDTDVLIDHLRGEEKAREFLIRCKAADITILVSAVTKAELYSGVRPKEEEALNQLLNSMEEMVVDGQVAYHAGKYRQKYGSSHGVLLPDALIAGCAKKAGATLVSLNKRHYPMRDIKVLVPYKKY